MGKPFVTTYHGAYGEVGPFKAAYNSVMARGDRVIANSRYTASVIRARNAGVQERIRIIYRGVDRSIFDPATVDAHTVKKLRSSWSVPIGTKIVLHAARLSSIKGQRDLIAAAALAEAEGALNDAVIIATGDAPGHDAYREELIGLIARYNLGNKVRLVGHCREMPVAYLSAHVAVTTSTVPESFGRTSIEAQAMGCPVIVPELGALPETIITPERSPTGFTGWLFSPRDIASLASRIGRALALTTSERAAIGSRARDHVATNFRLAHMQGSTLAVYDELLGTDLAERFMRASPTEPGARGANCR
jgi:glycosyltransferase involved in cell wall biosynthesis